MRRLLQTGQRRRAVGDGRGSTSGNSSSRRLLELTVAGAPAGARPASTLARGAAAAASSSLSSLKRARPGQERLWTGSSTTEAAGAGGRRENAGFDIQVLGSASKMPTVHSSCPCIGARVGPTQLLFDVGEGTQRQFMRSFLNPSKVQGIFITHMHGDHIFGLPGMLLSFLSLVHDAAAGAESGGAAANPARAHTLRVFGPEGLYNYVAMTLRLCEARIGPNPLDGKAPIVVHELTGAGERRAPFTKRDPDFVTPGVEWRPIDRDPDGFWTMPPITNGNGGGVLCGPMHEEQFAFTVRAGPLLHSVPTFGYTVAERPRRGKLDAEKVRAMGLPPGPLYKKLSRGEDVILPNGRGVIRAAEVMGPPQRGRKLTVLGDTSDASAMAPLAMDSDVLVHEATLEDACAELAVLRGHSTPSMAARFARDVGARRLLLTHFSNRYSSHAPAAEDGWGGGGVPERPGVARLVQQAAAVLGDERRVLAAHDFLQVSVPPHGFDVVGAPPSRDGAASSSDGAGAGMASSVQWRGAGGAVASS